MRIALPVLALVLFMCGLALAVMSAGMKTSVVSGVSQEVHNVGTIGQQQADTTLYAGLAIMGAVLLGIEVITDWKQISNSQAQLPSFLKSTGC